SLFGLGMVNGLLPCGLVYVAAAAGMTTASWYFSAAFMLIFGLGTLPMMFGIGLLISSLTHHWRLRLQKLVPISLALVGGLLILRGSGLGIPVLSPAFSDHKAECEWCEAHEHR
ncbi:MAG: sulfite exporter TauE/SafE family protein, partial [Limisphaerales bacterium]